MLGVKVWSARNVWMSGRELITDRCFRDELFSVKVLGKGRSTPNPLDVGSIPQKKFNRNDAVTWELTVDSGYKRAIACCTLQGAKLGDRIEL